ncbi:MAG: hypothetical protein JWO36_4682 [Myxococcales bacterium]|nr:hypothetical protein [Myxococcales bacterium]
MDLLRPAHAHSRWPFVVVSALAASIGLNAGLLGVLALTSRPAALPFESPPRVQVAPMPVPIMVAMPRAATPCKAAVDSDPDPARWTIGTDHVGPFSACATYTLDAVRDLVPALTVTAEPFDQDITHSIIHIAHDGKPLLTIGPRINNNTDLTITIESREIATPWGVRVGDRVRDGLSRYRDLHCYYGAAEGEENLWCSRGAGVERVEDGTSYDLEVAPVDRAMLASSNGDISVKDVAHIRIKTISWISRAAD